jgi:dihydrofolate synthase/folylpolyglutamate synthase
LDYRETLAFLDAHINHEATAGRIRGLSLDPMRALTDVLGDPQRAYPVIHLTGTNGKGSTGRMITALLVEHGLSVGSYTSPHLQRVNERLAWNAESIDDDDLARVVTELARLAPLAGVEPSYFELLTAAAFLWFAEIAVDVAVVEVGLLGRFDATNVADADVAVVTNVGQDHTDGVGDWRLRIASEKAGIIAGESTLVLGETDAELAPIFLAEGPRRAWRRGEDFDVVEELSAVGGQVVAVRTPHGTVDDVFLPLHGRHQAVNAACAFFDRPLDSDVARQALAGLTMPGRLEVVQRSPLVLLDGAHNPQGAMALADAVAEEFDVPGRRILVVGLLAGRDPLQMLEALDAGRADLLIACTPDSARAIPAEELVAAASRVPVMAEAAGDPADALGRALALCTEDDAVVVAGSLYVAGAARTEIERRLREDL